MRTNRHPMDYIRRPTRPTAEQLQKEQKALAWLGYLLSAKRRGLITHQEFDRLLNRGPAPTTIKAQEAITA